MIIGRKVIVKDEVASTNDVAKALANEGEAEGLVVTAKTQVAGRGRMGRSWSSPEGGLYLSVILRPKVGAEDMLRLTVLACVPVAETIEEVSGCKTMVKWPNDIEIGGKKVAGLLVESASRGGEIAYMVLGIGINLNLEPAGLSIPGATSVSSCAAKRIDRDAFLDLLLYRLDAFYAAVPQGDVRDGRLQQAFVDHRLGGRRGDGRQEDLGQGDRGGPRRSAHDTRDRRQHLPHNIGARYHRQEVQSVTLE